jgi:RNase P subunit RPR2
MAMMEYLAEKELHGTARCSRCRGFMVIEQGFNSMLGTSEANVLLRRCVQCGEIIDPVILKNRLLQSGSHPTPVHK